MQGSELVFEKLRIFEEKNKSDDIMKNERE